MMNLIIGVKTGCEPWSELLNPDIFSPFITPLGVDGAIQHSIDLWPRDMIRHVWKAQGQKPFPGNPCNVRAWTRSHEVQPGKWASGTDIFVDASETPDSVLWLAWHGVATRQQSLIPFVDMTVRCLEAQPEDRDAASASFPDLLATRMTGKNRDEAWWRKRKAKVRGECR